MMGGLGPVSRRAAKQPLVSVVMTTRNAEQHIGRAVESVLSQGSTDIQLLVADRGSTDGTVRILEGIAEREISLDVLNLGDADEEAALDAAIAASRGRYILVMGQNDWFAPHALEALAQALAASELEMGIMALSIDTYLGHGERVSQVLDVPLAPTSSASEFRHGAAPLIEQGLFSVLRGKALLHARIDDLGLRMALCKSQVSFLAAYLEDVARVAVVSDAVYHATAAGESLAAPGGLAYAHREREHERLLELVSYWHLEDDHDLVIAVHRLHLRQIVASIERIVLARGISSIERTERVRDILEAPGTQRTIEALDKARGPAGLMYRWVARRNVMGCCLGARISKLAYASRLPLPRHPLSMLGLM